MQFYSVEFIVRCPCQILSLLAQFPSVEPVLIAPLGGNEEGRRILRDLENEGVVTKFCKIWREAGVPNSWVLQSGLYFMF